MMRNFYRRELPPGCISFESADGKKVFAEALVNGHMESYFPLAAQFRTQDEPAYCGLTTLVMVLNSLSVDPGRIWKGVWRWYHEDMLNCCVPLSMIKKEGITLEHCVCLAECNSLDTLVTRVTNDADQEKQSLENFRSVVMRSSQQTTEFLVCSYSRAVLGQTGSGHFSTIAGYHKERDLVLILDTARFKYPPHWVQLEKLHKAMQQPDSATGNPRGFVLLTRAIGIKQQILFSLGRKFTVDDFPEMIRYFKERWQKFLSCGDPDIRSAATTLLHLLEPVVARGFNVLEIRACKPGDTPPNCQVICEHRSAVSCLLSAIEGTELFFAVEIALQEEPSPAIELIQRLLDDANHTYCCEERIKSSHLLTFLLLSWPYESLPNPPKLLTATVNATLSKVNEILTNEARALRRQINTVLIKVGCCSSKCDSREHEMCVKGKCTCCVKGRETNAT